MKSRCNINYERSDIASALYLYEQGLELSRRIHDLFMIRIAASSLVTTEKQLFCFANLSVRDDGVIPMR